MTIVTGNTTLALGQTNKFCQDGSLTLFPQEMGWLLFQLPKIILH
jgi:hypothetical protein